MTLGEATLIIVMGLLALFFTPIILHLIKANRRPEP
jgi:hypothetical protein